MFSELVFNSLVPPLPKTQSKKISSLPPPKKEKKE
jgi:hypothetical protein